MALSQTQCLDDNNVNWRMNESKPEFFYSEDQRLALEALLHGGRDAFEKYIQTHKVREFLSNLELDRLLRTAEVYNPESDDPKVESNGEIEDVAVSLQYWPDRSDNSVPDLDMGWPDYSSYRGVTRVSVYTQPPMVGQAHIKEIVRKTIAHAQKVIAVVMDLFTDVDIFTDLLDASFKRKVAVYIILDNTGLPHFLNMCERARMHTGHLKNLRIRSTRGMEFYTRSSSRVFGSMDQKFMFVDGDRAVSGSYSFTWTASRLDRNLITVLTGQAVESFDKQFQNLYLTSRPVDLSGISLLDEPEPEPLPAPPPAPVISAAMARKLINPKYALVNSGAVQTQTGTPSEKNGLKNCGQKTLEVKVPERQRDSAIHPGLLNLEKVHLIHYLPTWPDPDPPSDVIGFINIRDSHKPMQARLMRSELESSQAIRFKDPFSPVEDPLPEKAFLRPKREEGPLVAPQAVQDKAQPALETSLNRLGRTEPALDQTAVHVPGKVEKVLPPTPKPRTVRLRIVVDRREDAAEVSQALTSEESDTPSGQIAGHIRHPPGADRSPNLVTPSREGLRTAKEESFPGSDKNKSKKMESDDTETEGVVAPPSQCPREASTISTTSEEYFDCYNSSPEIMANGMHSLLPGNQESPAGLNIVAGPSPPTLESEPGGKQQQPEMEDVTRQQETLVISTDVKRKQNQANSDANKPGQILKRSTDVRAHSDRAVQRPGGPQGGKTKPGNCSCSAQASGPSFGPGNGPIRAGLDRLLQTQPMRTRNRLSPAKAVRRSRGHLDTFLHPFWQC